MSIDYQRIGNITFRELESALFRDCFLLRGGKGSHRRYKSEDPTGRRATRYVTLAYHHQGQTFSPGTLRSIIGVQAKWTKPDLIRLKLIRA